MSSKNIYDIPDDEVARLIALGENKDDEHRREFKTSFKVGGRFFRVLTSPLRMSFMDPSKDAAISVTTTPALKPEFARAIANSMRLLGSITHAPDIKSKEPIFVFPLGNGYKISLVPDGDEVLLLVGIEADKKAFSFDIALTASELTFLADMIFIAADVEACEPIPGRDFRVRSSPFPHRIPGL